MDQQTVYGKKYYLDEIKIDGLIPTPEYQAAAKRQREGTPLPGDMQILLNPGYQMKENKR